MPRFVLIEHSLESVGTHCYENAVRVLNAAQRAGFEPILATNRAFAPQQLWPARWRVFPLFRYRFLGKYSLGMGKVDRPAWYDRWRIAVGQRRRVRAFRRACATLFQQVSIESGDHVFLPTVFDLDVLGLAEFLHASAPSRRAVWHLYFHTNFLNGRPPQYSDQEHTGRAMRHVLERLQRVCSTHDVRCYTTTDELADQYNRLGVLHFRVLDYPVDAAPAVLLEERANPAVCQAAVGQVAVGQVEAGHAVSTLSRQVHGSRAEGPLRIVCAGHQRPEKGELGLANLVEDLWDEFLTPRIVQLLVQAHDASAPFVKARRTDRPFEGASEPVVAVPHPLATSEYLDFLRCADIGLFPYDSEAYYARLSSVFVELLAAGKPVLVPAGCWMSRQVDRQNHAHLDRLVHKLHLLQQRTVPSDEPAFVLDCPPGATELLIRFRWPAGAQAGEFVQWRCEQLPTTEQLPTAEQRATTATVGQRGAEKVPVLFHLNTGRQVRLSYRNAFGSARIVVEEIEVSFFACGEASPPAGSIGLIFDDWRMIPYLLRDLVSHYAHYRSQAETHSLSWRQRYNSTTVIQQLTQQLTQQIEVHQAQGHAPLAPRPATTADEKTRTSSEPGRR